MKLLGNGITRIKLLGGDRRGITGLETAIVLIAFVVVSSVFAFAALSTGLFSSDKAKETIQAGLAETRGSMELKGSVILSAVSTGITSNVNDISFQVANAAGGESIDLTPGKTLIKYTDEDQSKMFVTTGPPGFTVTALGDAGHRQSAGAQRGVRDQINLSGLARHRQQPTDQQTWGQYDLPTGGDTAERGSAVHRAHHPCLPGQRHVA